MIALQNATAIRKNMTTSFNGSGGTDPYTYAVDPGGAGGTIDVNGVYTSPDALGTDTITITDAVLDTASASIAVLDPIGLFCDVLKNEMSLADDQVYIYNQRIDLPSDSRLYVAVGVLTPKPFGSSNKIEENGGDLQEIQTVNMGTTLSIDILSSSTQALERKEEIILALGSTYSQSQQELNSFYIAKQSSNFVNLSGGEDGARILYRFNISVNVQYSIKKIKNVEFFDTFEDVSVETDT